MPILTTEPHQESGRTLSAGRDQERSSSPPTARQRSGDTGVKESWRDGSQSGQIAGSRSFGQPFPDPAGRRSRMRMWIFAPLSCVEYPWGYSVRLMCKHASSHILSKKFIVSLAYAKWKHWSEITSLSIYTQFVSQSGCWIHLCATAAKGRPPAATWAATPRGTSTFGTIVRGSTPQGEVNLSPNLA